MSSPFDIRALSEADVAATAAIDSAAFGYQPTEDYFRTVARPRWELDRFLGAFDPARDGEQAGSAGAYSMTMTFPGGHPHPVAGVTWVGVRPDQQRRGVLTAMMRHQLDDLHDAGREPVAILTASEAPIYGRFGYGLAVDRIRLEAPAGLAFRPGVRTEPVRQLPGDRALPLVRDLYTRAIGRVTGLMTRSEAVWNAVYSDRDDDRDGATALFFALHDDGFVAYRIKPDWTDRGPASTLLVHEISALTPIAWASLWRHVLDYPLVREVVYRRAWVDDPLRDLVVDVRALRMPATDHVWLRLVDLDRAVGLRSYRTACSVTVGLTDAFCPWNAGSLAAGAGRTGWYGHAGARETAGAPGHHRSGRGIPRRPALGPAGGRRPGGRRSGIDRGSRCGALHAAGAVGTGGLLTRVWGMLEP